MADRHSASASLLGYLYQCRYALLAGIEISKSKPGFTISIEKFDDVAFEEAGVPKEQIQTKHHGSAGDLTDSSVDLWKTLGIWSESTHENAQFVFETQLTIMTTGAAPDGTACAFLRSGKSLSDTTKAQQLLVKAAQESTNKTTKTHRDRFLSLDPTVQLALCKAIVVYDNAPTITDVRSEIEEVLQFATASEHVGTLVDYLEGWWFAVVIQSLSSASIIPISVVSIRQKIDELREAFKAGQLPLDEAAIDVVPSDGASDNRTFVQQMKCIGISDASVKMAVRDFYRASAQRSRWARESLLLDNEARRYDDELVDRWTRQFEANKDAGDLTCDSGKADCGRKTFHWANQSQLPFRNRSEMWLTTGSYQMLSDQVELGWHPEYQTKFGSAKGAK